MVILHSRPIRFAAACFYSHLLLPVGTSRPSFWRSMPPHIYVDRCVCWLFVAEVSFSERHIGTRLFVARCSLLVSRCSVLFCSRCSCLVACYPQQATRHERREPEENRGFPILPRPTIPIVPTTWPPSRLSTCTRSSATLWRLYCRRRTRSGSPGSSTISSDWNTNNGALYTFTSLSGVFQSICRRTIEVEPVALWPTG